MEINAGFEGLLNFLDYLRDRKILFKVEGDIPGCIMVTIVLVGERLEIYFYPDYVAYSVFSGDESMKDDFEALAKMFDEFKAE